MKFSFPQEGSMKHDLLLDQPAAVIPFQLHGREGKLAVYYGVNTDPIQAGFDFLAGLNFDINLCRGYPVMHARIEEYAGSGYRTICGWVQLVTRLDQDNLDPAQARSTTTVSIDLAPAFQEVHLPFVCFGNLPQFFDAPCLNLGSSTRLVWTADTFLTTTPLRSGEEPIECLAGFRWGYIETSQPGQAPALLPLEVTGPEAWNAHLPFLREKYGDWRFVEAES
jgi:hypothetical protein